MAGWTLPPGWASAHSKSQNRAYYYRVSDPSKTQWHEPSWDIVVAEGYARTPEASQSSASFRALQNWIKQSLLFVLVWSRDVHSLLDLACGKGGDAGKVPETVDYTGIDLCPQSIALAKQRHPGKTFSVASFNDEDSFSAAIAHSRYDACICMFALHYATSLRDVLRRVRRTLKPGGVFLFTTFDENEVERTPEGRGSIRIVKHEVQGSKRRVWVQMEGSVDMLPEAILSTHDILEAAQASSFKVASSQTFGAAMTDFGIGQQLDPEDSVAVQQRDALYWIRDRYYAKWKDTWSAEVWHMADLYKAVVLIAE